MHLFLNIISEMAKSVDPDQTAPTGAILFNTLMYEIWVHLL